MPWIHVKPNSDFSTILHFFGKFSSKNCHQNPNKNWGFFSSKFSENVSKYLQNKLDASEESNLNIWQMYFPFFSGQFAAANIQILGSQFIAWCLSGVEYADPSNWRILSKCVCRPYQQGPRKWHTVFLVFWGEHAQNGIQLSLGLENYLMETLICNFMLSAKELL